MIPSLFALLCPLAVIVLPVVWLIAMYNGLVRLRNFCSESWADIDTELKRRYDLIPNLVETVKGYAKHEQDTLASVIQARNIAAANHGSPEAQAQDENELVHGLDRLFALAEGYPDLKANQNFLELQQELARTENRIARARRFYNANVRDINTRVEVFPSNLVANMFGFAKQAYFNIDDPVQRGAVAIDLT